MLSTTAGQTSNQAHLCLTEQEPHPDLGRLAQVGRHQSGLRGRGSDYGSISAAPNYGGGPTVVGNGTRLCQKGRAVRAGEAGNFDQGEHGLVYITSERAWRASLSTYTRGLSLPLIR